MRIDSDKTRVITQPRVGESVAAGDFEEVR